MKAYGWHWRAVNVSGKRGEGRNTGPPFPKYPRWKVSGRETSVFPAKKWLPECDTTDTGRGVSNTGRVYRIDYLQGPKPLPAAARPAGIGVWLWTDLQEGPQNTGGVPVSTGWQEVQIACRGWSAGHVKSRPSFNCRSSVFSGCLIKQPRAMAPVGRASQSVAKSDSPRFTA
jgi:hypothetical protein